MLCLLVKKMPQSSTVRKRFGSGKIKNVMAIAD
ncbi:conserved hypothetical protein [Escherichia coli M605]|uniref:Uncharacterized protein n=1 Tax=Escherichia coli M605 TaxID=656417 RepID=F4SVZ3_ECOLX|nr:conserved hypothetical protein [Escherichia coli M605]OSL77831.1 hypothetical protein EAYG_00481 [Escherichia coli TA014]